MVRRSEIIVPGKMKSPVGLPGVALIADGIVQWVGADLFHFSPAASNHLQIAEPP
jgi:hypothetical protein